ncbi:MAG: four helix bundle protein [Gemmatimonadales bacterium]|nr:four helix bundle protein [Gemmatimonadales bacterium]
MHPFTRLRTWVAAHDLSIIVYRTTRGFPPEERFGLLTQLRRATYSIEANIAEGARRRTQAEFRRFLDIASGSASEVHCYLLLARDLGIVAEHEAAALIDRVVVVKRMLEALARRIKSP